jgi:hypothetical protein
VLALAVHVACAMRGEEKGAHGMREKSMVTTGNF